MRNDADIINRTFDESRRIIGEMVNGCREPLERIADLLCATLQSSHKILLCGNGGSAADSQHIAAELVVRFQKERKGLPAIALTTDTSILTASANDFDFSHVFSRQVEALGQIGDVLIGFSTSGTSKNVIRAIETARIQRMKSIVFSGNRKGPVVSLADEVLEVPSDVTARIQEAHIIAGHILCDLIETRLFPDT